MKKVKFSELNKDEMFLHFTKERNVDSIEEKGLLPSIGENSKGKKPGEGEKTPKSFFAKGVEGANEILDVWLKWFIFTEQRNRYMDDPQSPQDDAENCYRFHQDALNNKLATPEMKAFAFNKLYNMMSCHAYLALDLEEGKDFDYNDVDEIKKKCANDKEWLEVLYGKVQNMEGLERWNMHTKVGLIVPPEKITQVTDENGNEDALSIIKELYELGRDKDIDVPMLDEFMQYTKERERQEREREERERQEREERQKKAGSSEEEEEEGYEPTLGGPCRW